MMTVAAYCTFLGNAKTVIEIATFSVVQNHAGIEVEGSDKNLAAVEDKRLVPVREHPDKVERSRWRFFPCAGIGFVLESSIFPSVFFRSPPDIPSRQLSTFRLRFGRSAP